MEPEEDTTRVPGERFRSVIDVVAIRSARDHSTLETELEILGPCRCVGDGKECSHYCKRKRALHGSPFGWMRRLRRLASGCSHNIRGGPGVLAWGAARTEVSIKQGLLRSGGPDCSIASGRCHGPISTSATARNSNGAP